MTNFILLSAGKSKIRHEKAPTPLISVRGECLIDIQIKTIRSKFNDADIILVTGFNSDSVVEYVMSKYRDVRIVENTSYKTTSSLNSLKIGLNSMLEANSFVIHGDRLFDEQSLNVNINKSSILSHKIIKKNHNIGISFNTRQFLNIEYGLPHVWSEILYIAKQDYQLIKKQANLAAKLKTYTIPDLIRKVSGKIDFTPIYDESSEVLHIKEIR